MSNLVETHLHISQSVVGKRCEILQADSDKTIGQNVRFFITLLNPHHTGVHISQLIHMLKKNNVPSFNFSDSENFIAQILTDPLIYIYEGYLV
jgi:hypothetical protein